MTGNIRPKDLPRVTTVTAGDTVMLDGATVRSITWENFNKSAGPLFVFEGDSLSDVTGVGTWPLKLTGSSGFFGRGSSVNFALAGDTAAAMVGEYSAQAGAQFLWTGREAWYFLWAGTNDIVSGTAAATIYGYLTTMWAAARASGYKVCAFTIMRRGDATSGQNDVRIALNALIRSDPTLYDSLVQPDLYFINTADDTIFLQTGPSATVHMTANGNAVLAQKVAAAVLGTASLYAAPLDALAYNGLQMNGAADIDQRNAGAAVAGLAAGTTKLIDGWKAQILGTAVLTAQQVSDAPPGLTKSFKLSVTTAEAVLGSTDGVFVNVPFVGYRSARLAFGTLNAQPVAIGFWVKAHRPGLYSAALRNFAGDRSWPFGFTVNNADTWEFKSTWIPGDVTGTWIGNTNGEGLRLLIAVALGSSFLVASSAWTGGSLGMSGTTNGVAATTDTFQVTGLILLPGTEVPRGDQVGRILRPADQELNLCKSQFEKSFAAATAPAQNVGINTGEYGFQIITAGATAQRSPSWPLYPKIKPPTMTGYNPAAANGQIRDLTAGADFSGTAFATVGDSSFRVTGTGAAGSAAGNIAGFHWTADSSL